jgi:hypothetical protein
MLPNSRIIPPNNNNNNNNVNLSSHKKARSRSNSAINDNAKKGFISRLLMNPKDQPPPPIPQRPKYDTVLCIQNKDDYAAWGTPRSSSEHSKV